MNEPKIYYEKNNVKVTFDPAKQGYLLGFKPSEKGNYLPNHFIDERAFQDVLNSDTSGRLDKLNTLDEMILFSMNQCGINPNFLFQALDKIKSQLEKELAQFKEANNL
ncbi:hypothetical protein HOD29_03420 [archaeon]|jgi:hypothetical protein|nr:hypothetical protein [archaeon]